MYCSHEFLYNAFKIIDPKFPLMYRSHNFIKNFLFEQRISAQIIHLHKFLEVIVPFTHCGREFVCIATYIERVMDIKISL